MARFTDSKFSEGFETLRLLALHPDFTEELARNIRQDGGADRALAALRREFINQKAAPSVLDIIEVPNLPASDLIAQAHKVINFTFLNPDLSAWDFYKNQKGEVVDQGGKRYEVMTRAPGLKVSTDEVRNHFPKGFHGNTAASVVWVMKNQPRGCHVSIPEDDRLWCGPDGILCAPAFFHDVQCRVLGLKRVDVDWDDVNVFVAFREILP